MATIRKRGRPRGSTDSIPRKRRAVEDLGEEEQPVHGSNMPETPAQYASPTPKGTRLKRKTKSILLSTPARGDSKYDVPGSPHDQDGTNETEARKSPGKKLPRVLLPRVGEEDSVGKAVGEPQHKVKRRQFKGRNARDGDEVFKGKQFGSLQEVERGAILTSINTPARTKRSKSSRKLDIQSVATANQSQVELESMSVVHNHLQDEGLELDGMPSRVAPGQDTSPNPANHAEKTTRDRRLSRQGLQQAEQGSKSGADNVSVASDDNLPSMSKPVSDRSKNTPNTQIENGDDRCVGRSDVRKRGQNTAESDIDISRVRSPSIIDDADDQSREHVEKDDVEADKRRKAQFMKGIEDCSQHLAVAESLANVGLAALKIKHEFSEKKEDHDELRTARSKIVWRRLAVLKGLYTAASPPDHKTALPAIEKLARVATRKRLQKNPKGDQSRADTCILDLFHYIVPRSVELIRRALLAHCATTFPAEVTEQILRLIEIAYSISDTALEWRPKPNLEPGLRSRVHNDIRPGLRAVRATIKTRFDHLQTQERMKLRTEKLTRSQQARLADLEQARRRLTGRVQRRPQNTNNGVCDVDEIPESEDESTPRRTQTAHHVHKPRPVRQNTADIPAPDPSTIWTDRESKFLIDGLIRHTGLDRFEAIAAIPALREKDIDQIMAMSRRLREMWAARIKTSRSRGDKQYEWLATVP